MNVLSHLCINVSYYSRHFARPKFWKLLFSCTVLKNLRMGKTFFSLHQTNPYSFKGYFILLIFCKPFYTVTFYRISFSSFSFQLSVFFFFFLFFLFIETIFFSSSLLLSILVFYALTIFCVCLHVHVTCGEAMVVYVMLISMIIIM